MAILILTVGLSSMLVQLVSGEPINSVNTTARKDMYVVRATIYQVGILTKAKPDKTEIIPPDSMGSMPKTNTLFNLHKNLPNKLFFLIHMGTGTIYRGRQESITFYKSNGSSIDMKAISHPLLTNVTVENVVGLAPVTNASDHILPWSSLKDFALKPQGIVQPEEVSKISKREVAKVENVAVLIPKETGVQSIALPPLLTLNKNMSKIPVPIPNVSIVSYEKVNSLVHP